MAEADFSFAWEDAEPAPTKWGHLQVVDFHGTERLSAPYRYDLTLVARKPSPEVDPRDLIGKRGSLRLDTQSTPKHKVVHGIVAEATEVDELPEGMVYRVALVAPWARARHRTRCRIFLEKTTREIVEAVLQGDPLMSKLENATVEHDDGSPDFEAAAEQFTWRVQDKSRIDARRARPYVVQYNESDFDFVARLLEEEGISYHFENGKEACLLVFSDHDGGRARLEDDRLGIGIDGREVRHVRLGSRLRPKGVVLDDYNWKKPKHPMAARAEDGPAGDLVEYHYPAGHPDEPGQAEPLAKAIVDRYHVESNYVVMDGGVRVLSAGSIFALEHDDADLEGEYLVTSFDVRGHQAGVLSQAGISNVGEMAGKPFMARFECARRGAGRKAEESRFRPARSTSKPLVRGTQTAIVTADPGTGAEVNVGGPDGLSIGCVRVKFRWDTEHERLSKEPSSTWVRVSQIFAGAGEGAVWHPRVGDEVLVEYENGDPDRPVVIGRVYNGANLPPRTAPPESTMKSLSTPGGGTYNEFMFDDTAGGELVHYYAGLNQTTDVANYREENVGANATMTVGANNTENIGANCTVMIGANDTVTVGANQTNMVSANCSSIIGATSTKTVGANEVNIVGASQTVNIGGALSETVGGPVLEVYGASKTTNVAASVSQTYGATRMVTVGGIVSQLYGGSHSLKVGAARLMMIGGSQFEIVGGSVSEQSSLYLQLSGGACTRTMPNAATTTPLFATIAARSHKAAWTQHSNRWGIGASITGLSLSVTGRSSSKFAARMGITGVSLGLSAGKSKSRGAKLDLIGVYVICRGAKVTPGGPELNT